MVIFTVGNCAHVAILDRFRENVAEVCGEILKEIARDNRRGILSSSEINDLRTAPKFREKKADGRATPSCEPSCLDALTKENKLLFAPRQEVGLLGEFSLTRLRRWTRERKYAPE